MSLLGEEPSVDVDTQMEEANSQPDCDEAPSRGIRGYRFGDDLDWSSPKVPVLLGVELPFWLMVHNCEVELSVGGYKFQVGICDDCYEWFLREMLDSRATRFLFNSSTCFDNMPEEAKSYLEEHPVPFFRRKAKTVLFIKSACISSMVDETTAEVSGKKTGLAGVYYMRAFCEAHLEVVNRLVRDYRLKTYDYFARELSPADLPVWWLEREGDGLSIPFFVYGQLDRRPLVGELGGPYDPLTLTDSETMSKPPLVPAPGEFDLLDAMNLMEMGDYAGAVRRLVTAIEVLLEHKLRDALWRTMTEAQVDEYMKETRFGFRKRLKKFQEVTNRHDDWILTATDDIRKLRHRIVHDGWRIPFNERGSAQMAVDTGRWVFNWIENKEERQKLREGRLCERSIGSHALASLFRYEITFDGVNIRMPGGRD